MANSMLKTSLRFALALGAFFVVAIVLAACGGSSNSIPGDAVAVVNGTPITKADYTRWASITARSAAGNNPAAVVPDPPTYTNCIAALRKQTPKGQKAPATATLIAQCKAQDQQILQQTMGTLLQSAWIEGEAKKQGVTVSQTDVNKQLVITKKQSFPTAAAYDKFLKQSGMTASDVTDRVRVQLLAQHITQKIQKQAKPVTSAQVTAYYNKNRAQFAVPERRDLLIVLTKTQAQAQAAKAALASGQKWAAVAKKYSTDPASKATGGVLRGVAKGQQDRALDQAAFSAKKGVTVGPVKGQFGWYLVQVTAITPPQQTTLAQAQAQIKPLLTQQAQQKLLASFVTDFQKRWKAETNCRAGYVVAICKNAPTPKAPTSTTGGTVATTPQSGSGTTTTSK
jgi:foldase protein PrsA